MIKDFHIYFKENKQKIIPDYVSDNSIADAKYMMLGKDSKNFDEEKANAVYYKTITYMLRFNNKSVYLFYPANNEFADKILEIKDNEEWKIIERGLYIPQECIGTEKFLNEIKESEKNFLNKIDSKI